MRATTCAVSAALATLLVHGDARAQVPPNVPLVPPPPVLPPPPPAAVMVRSPEPPPVPDVRTELGRARIGAGYRASIVSDPTFDTFARSGLLSQLSLDGTYVVVASERTAFATGVAWDFGSRQGLYDGFDLSLQVHRLTVPLELRWLATPSVYLFGRAAPGGAHYRVTVHDPAVPLAGGPWVFALDASVGAAVLLGPRGALDRRIARVWLTPEIGYGWAGERELRLSAEREPILVASAPESIGSLTSRGFFFRAQIGLTF